MRTLVMLRKGVDAGHFTSRLGFRTVSAADFPDSAVRLETIGTRALILEHLHAVILPASRTRQQRLRELLGGPVLAIEPAGSVEAAGDPVPYWNLDAVGVRTTRWSGQGVRIGVLDTGLDPQHPDFAGRSLAGHSFVPGWSQPRDGSGHGTHCLGLVARIAPSAELFVGKVLNDAGEGDGISLTTGLNWALANRCRVVLLSLGWPVDQPSAFFELAGRRAMAAGTLLIAAAGNDSRRSEGRLEPVNCPACCRSFLSVGSVDCDLRPANSSNAGRVDLVAPGVKVPSSFPLPIGTGRKSGTSVAAAHVAGIAALHLEADPGLTPRELKERLRRTARRLPLPRRDAGAGLVQAPQNQSMGTST